MMIATQITGFGSNGTASDAKYLILAVQQVGRTIVGWLCLREFRFWLTFRGACTLSDGVG